MHNGVWWKAAGSSGGKGGGKNGGKANGKGGKANGKGGDKGGKGPSAGGKAGGNAHAGGNRPEPFLCIPCQGYKNFGWRTHCNMCGRGRAKAVLPIPAREEQEPQEEEEWTAGGLSNNQRKKLRKQLTIQAEKLGVTLVGSMQADQQAAAVTMEGPKSVRYTPTTAEALGEPPKVSIPAFGINPLPTVKEPKKAFVYPPC